MWTVPSGLVPIRGKVPTQRLRVYSFNGLVVNYQV